MIQVAWITVSHPGLTTEDSIGDMVRLKTLAGGLRAGGWLVELITWRDRAKTRTNTAGSDAGHHGLIHAAMKRIVPRACWNTLKDTSYLRLNRKFYDLLNSVEVPRPSAIIDYNFYLNDAALRFGRHMGVPVYLNFEGFIFDSMLGPPNSWLRRFGEAFEMKKYKSVDAILCVSEPLRDELNRRMGAAAPPLHVVPNAVDLSIFRPVEKPDRAVPVVGFVGGLSPWYAIDKLIEVCHSIRTSGTPLRLEIIGDGPERENLHALVHRLRAADWCTFTGLIPHDRVNERIAGFDIGVITNHKWWTSPLKLLEYGAAGLPVIAPAIGSITSMVGGDDLMLFEPERWDQFHDALLCLVKDRNRCAVLGARLHQQIAGRYTIDAMSEHLEAILTY